MGVWIEISQGFKWDPMCNVTPRVGVWIEIFRILNLSCTAETSLPVWECGLKFSYSNKLVICHTVTPRVGVWIEILLSNQHNYKEHCHSPCGSVD